MHIISGPLGCNLQWHGIGSFSLCFKGCALYQWSDDVVQIQIDPDVLDAVKVRLPEIISSCPTPDLGPVLSRVTATFRLPELAALLAGVETRLLQAITDGDFEAPGVPNSLCLVAAANFDVKVLPTVQART